MILTMACCHNGGWVKRYYLFITHMVVILILYGKFMLLNGGLKINIFLKQKLLMIVVFKNNSISIDGESTDDHKKISALWDEVRECYTDWVADFRLKKIDKLTIAESLEWKGMSTWWLSPLVARDSEQDNRWLHRL